MTDLTPYASPASSSILPEQAQPSRAKKLWMGYLIAPPVAPVLAAAAIFFGGEYLIDPDDMGTPIGIIILPIFFVTLGVVISYFLTLAIGMPIALLLDRRNILNGYTIHLAAITLSVLFGIISVFLPLLGGANPPEPITVGEVLTAIGITSLGAGFFVVITATVFWLIACKPGRKIPQLDQRES